MYSGYGFRKSEIGDVDVVVHDGEYHLFHLTLPNHDYIAHAVSRDGLHWRRVKNALFISDPPAWDDDMLWTMHVSRDPYQPGSWRMFYTGLSMEERGRVQRLGLAVSDDLYHWRKVNQGAFPLEAKSPHYESTVDEGRHWVSFRDPCFFEQDGNGCLVVSARVPQGPIIRRGCVALLKETAANQFELQAPLFHPMRYDDLEVPSLVRLRDRYYLICSIREDIKIHYWYADKLEGPYRNLADNVLLPQGNYAARICQDDGRYLVWNFFYKGLKIEGLHLMAPPKELVADDDGRLRLRRFAGFRDVFSSPQDPEQLFPLAPVLGNPTASFDTAPGMCRVACESGMEMFLMQGEFDDFVLSGDLHIDESGKCGLLLRVDDEGDGYFLSLDLYKGMAQLRAWAFNPEGSYEESFHYQQLQGSNFLTGQGPYRFSLLAYGQYFELTLNGFIVLSLADDQFSRGRIGFYSEGATFTVENLTFWTPTKPVSPEYPETLERL
ncbi:MAG: glycosyl hydrolase [Gammaproteobacteria bacterium]|nr:glycosyl hydrolase [Gammaproteobacteria bacterium]